VFWLNFVGLLRAPWFSSAREGSFVPAGRACTKAKFRFCKDSVPKQLCQVPLAVKIIGIFVPKDIFVLFSREISIFLISHALTKTAEKPKKGR
jgi:hypothetical protein